jgi:hypothetical protein
VQDGQWQVRKALGDTRLQLGREVDLGDQHQYLGGRVLVQSGGDGVEIDFVLPLPVTPCSRKAA